MNIYPCSLDQLHDAQGFLQTGFWGKLKEHFGWKALGFRIQMHSTNKKSLQDFPLLVLLRNLNNKMTLAYIPHGPTDKAFFPLPAKREPSLEGNLTELAQALQPYVTPSTFALRFDLLSGILQQNDALPILPPCLVSPLRKSPYDVQPASTVILDLSVSMETLLEKMKKKTRYNIRLAEKKGVTVGLGSLEELPLWYQLYQDTARRDKISTRHYDYYKTLFKLAQEKDSPVQVHLLLAYHGSNLLAGNIVLIYRQQGVYLYGASSNQDRHLMAPYVLQFKGIELCQQAGCQTYDLFGIPFSGDPNHPMHGLYRFKTGFGGQVFHRHGTWDFCYKPIEYHLMHLAGRMRSWYYKKWKKRA